MIPFIKYRKIFYGISFFLVTLSLLSVLFFGLNLGIEFTGGSSLEIKFKTHRPSVKELKETLKDLKLGKIVIQEKAEKEILLKMKNIEENVHQEVLKRLRTLGEIEPGSEKFRSIGPVIGKELKRKTKIVMMVALFGILIYIALSFQKISRPVKSYIFGLSSLIALCHDVLVPLGVLAFLGKFGRVEITIPIITAFLTIFGYSINDSVVVFDRVRENLKKSRGEIFDLIVEKSLNQTLIRSLNTSFTTLLALFGIFFFGGETLKYFSLTLILGIFFGTYSSLFLATPLLTSYLRFQQKKKSSF